MQFSLQPKLRVWAPGLEQSSLAVAKHRVALLPGTESHCSQHNGEHSFAFRMRLGPGMFILFLLPEGTVDTVSPGDWNQLLGNLAFPAHPHTDDPGRLPVGRGVESQPLAHHTSRLWRKVISSKAAPFCSCPVSFWACPDLFWGRGLSWKALLKQGRDLRSFLFSRVPLATGASRGRKERR